MKAKFNDEMIKRERSHALGPLPIDAFELIHDIAYHHDGRDVDSYVRRAQEILRYPNLRKP